MWAKDIDGRFWNLHQLEAIWSDERYPGQDAYAWGSKRFVHNDEAEKLGLPKIYQVFARFIGLTQGEFCPCFYKGLKEEMALKCINDIIKYTTYGAALPKEPVLEWSD